MITFFKLITLIGVEFVSYSGDIYWSYVHESARSLDMEFFDLKRPIYYFFCVTNEH